MNIQNRVFKKLAEVEKVELSAQKVELGLADEMKRAEKIVEAMKVTTKAFDKEVMSAERLVQDAVEKLDTSGLNKAFIMPANKIKRDLESAGLTSTKLYTDLKNWTPMFERSLKRAEKFKSKLKGLI